MEWWKIEKRFGYKKSLEQLKVNKHLIKYLTQIVPATIESCDHIFVCYDEKKNNIWNTDWIWNFEMKLEEGDIYCGTFNIKEQRKKKLIKLNEN